MRNDQSDLRLSMNGVQIVRGFEVLHGSNDRRSCQFRIAAHDAQQQHRTGRPEHRGVVMLYFAPLFLWCHPLMGGVQSVFLFGSVKRFGYIIPQSSSECRRPSATALQPFIIHFYRNIDRRRNESYLTGAALVSFSRLELLEAADRVHLQGSNVWRICHTRLLEISWLISFYG